MKAIIAVAGGSKPSLQEEELAFQVGVELAVTQV